MNTALVDRIVSATLYEGYILYPYRPTSVKNQVRWTFGGVHPRSYSEATRGSDPWEVQTECLLRDGGAATVEVRVRFLQLVARTVGWCDSAGADAGEIEAVDSLEVQGRVHRTWQEAEERDLDLGRHCVSALLEAPVHVGIGADARRWSEPLREADGTVVAALLREQQPLLGEVEIEATAAGDGLVRISVSVRNRSEVDASLCGREQALLSSFISTHAVLGVTGGSFLSLADPPEDAADAAAACRNRGLWPVLIGVAGDDDTVLASPIILEDHPQVAPESPGDLYDATEIDEILSLRILTLSDDEKAEMRGADERARALLDRTEALTSEDFMRMHGAIRSSGPKGVTTGEDAAAGPMANPQPPPPSESAVPDATTPVPANPWAMIGEDPFAEPSARTSVRCGDVILREGSRVRLAPRGRADVLDLVLRGRVATIASIEVDYEDHVHLAVTVDDDPGAEFGRMRQPGHRFFFGLDDVEPLGTSAGDD